MPITIRTESPENRRINNRQSGNRIIWRTEPWRFLRALFLSEPGNKGGCVWCGNIAVLVEHDDWKFYGTRDYLNFKKAGCVPMCLPCNRAKRRGLHLCPRCKRQGHYVVDGQVCWSCKSPEEREAAIYRAESRRRNRNAYNRKRAKEAYQIKKVKRRMVKTVRIQDDDTGTTTHWETCRYDQCIEYDCPRYYLCCGEVKR